MCCEFKEICDGDRDAIFCDADHFDKPWCFKCKGESQKPIESLHGRTKAEQRQEILDRMDCFYLQTDSTMDWPNSREGDLLKMMYALLTA